MAQSKTQAARDAALLRLMKMHAGDYARIYDEERVARGLKPMAPRRAERITRLREQLARLEAQEEN